MNLPEGDVLCGMCFTKYGVWQIMESLGSKLVGKTWWLTYECKECGLQIKIDEYAIKEK